MIKHTQTIHWQIANEMFEFFLSFCEIGVLRVKMNSVKLNKTNFGPAIQIFGLAISAHPALH